MANTKLPARLLDTSAVPTLNVTGTTTTNGNVIVVGSELRVQRPSGGTSYFGILMDTGEMVRLRNSWANKDIYFTREGNVGIGATPIALLDGNAAPGLTITSNGPYILLKDGNNADKVRYMSNNTGVYQLGIVGDNGTTGKTEHLRIDTNGNVGIGENNPDGIFHVKSASGVHRSRFESSSSHSLIRLIAGTGSNAGLEFYSGTGNVGNITADSSSNLLFEPGGAEKMRIDSNGNVGINMNPSGYGTLSVNGTGVILALRASSGGGRLGFYEGGAGRFYLDSLNGSDGLKFVDGDGTSERMRIHDTGQVLIGKQTIDFQTAGVRIDPTNLQVTSTGVQGYFNRLTDGASIEFYRGTSVVGSIGVATNGTYFATTSDRRLKENIIDAPSASDDIDSIQVRSYDWKSDGSHQKYGMVAQELQLVVPEAVTGVDYSTEMMSIDYSKLVPMLVKEIQSLRERVTQLENEK